MRWGGMWMYEEMIGKQYGNWTVISYSHFKERTYFCNTRKKMRNSKEHFLKVKCKCGVVRTVRPQPLKSGKSKGCGCEGNHTKTQFKSTHGKTNTRLYRIFLNMKERCYDEKSKDFKRYGSRGIKICDEWLNDFEAFYDWSMSNGYKNNLSIDRINNDGDYHPKNCRWADGRVQSNNRRSSVFLEYKEKRLTVTEWARLLNVKADTLHRRKRNGWTDEEIITIPIGGRR